MELENSTNLESNSNELVIEEEQNSFLESTIGKVVNSALDVGLRMILPDVIEDSVIEIKDSILENGVVEGLKTAVDNVIDFGKSILGIFTGNFETIEQARDTIKSGGIIDSISDLLDTAIDKISSTGIISESIITLISNGKDAILSNVSSNIEKEFMEQINGTTKLAEYEENWKEYFENKNFEGMEKEYKKITEQLEELLPIENTIKEARIIENLHNLIKNNGQDFTLTEEQIELANMLT